MVRRSHVVSLVVSLVLAVASLGATSSGTRTVRGRVVAGTTDPDAARCAWLQTDGRSQGLHAWIVELTAAEADGLHEFTLGTDGVGVALRVAFYDELAPCGSSARHLYHGEDQTWGYIPYGAAYAVIGSFEPSVPVCYGGLCGYPAVPATAAAFEFTVRGS